MTWAVFAAVMALVFRHDSTVLQNTKNLLPGLILVVFLFVRINDLRSIVILCNLYVLYAIIACGVAFLQYRFGGPYFRDLIEGTEWKLTVEGTIVDNPVVGFSGHPNEFAVTILPAVTLSVGKLIAEIRDRWRVRPITLGICGVLLAGMVLSQARGETIFTCAGIAFVASPLGRSRSFAIKVMAVASLIACIMAYGLHQASLGAPQAGTIEVRYRLWQTAWLAMHTDGYIPFLGDGTAFMTRWSLPVAGWEFPDAHNVWIDQAVFWGLPALGFYLAMWRRCFQLIEMAIPTLEHHAPVVLDGLRAALVALMGNYFFGAYANAVLPISQLYFLMAVVVCLSSLGSTSLRVPFSTRNARVCAS
jgi:hypothetical protein